MKEYTADVISIKLSREEFLNLTKSKLENIILAYDNVSSEWYDSEEKASNSINWNSDVSVDDEGIISLSTTYMMSCDSYGNEGADNFRIVEIDYCSNPKALKLKALRLLKKLSQSEFATKSGIPIKSIQHYEQGCRDIRKVQAEKLKKASEVLGCKMEELI